MKEFEAAFLNIKRGRRIGMLPPSISILPQTLKFSSASNSSSSSGGCAFTFKGAHNLGRGSLESERSKDLTNLYNVGQIFKYGFDFRYRTIFKHRKRIALLMKEFNIDRFIMITLTSRSDFRRLDYQRALNRVRRVLNYYGVDRITALEFTKRGRRHYHMLLPANELDKIFSSLSFLRFSQRYQFSKFDKKAIKKGKRSKNDILLARWLFSFWRLGFVDVLKEAKALYIVKYVKKDKRSYLSYSRSFLSYLKNKSSLIYLFFDNEVRKIKPVFRFPIFFIKNNNIAKSLRRLTYLYWLYQRNLDRLRSKGFKVHQLVYDYIERLGFMLS